MMLRQENLKGIRTVGLENKASYVVQKNVNRSIKLEKLGCCLIRI
jgi:hypothetical protein